MCYMYWIGVLYDLHWCIICTGLVCSMRGERHCPCTSIKEGGRWWEY